MPIGLHKKKNLTSFQVIIAGFAGVILLGALILMLPVATVSRVVTPFHETLFTATSAVCVTGLVVQDTGSYWSAFGQTIIVILIQIGGLGVVTVATAAVMFSGRKISLMQRSTMQDAISAPQVGGIVKMTRFILKGTCLIELVGAVLLLPFFCRDYGRKGIWLSLFHSVSAFCNAGFDLMGTVRQPFVSMTGYADQLPVNIVLMLLIVIGGIGFLTWDDICTHRFHLKHYRMQSKVILVTSACLIMIPAVWFFVNDFTSLPVRERLLASLFQSVTTRTAGFNTVDLSEMTDVSQAVMIVLMLIGGSPGSTAGGLKTTTFAVLILNAFTTFKNQENVEVFGRRLDMHVVRNAATIVMMYLTLFLAGGITISVYEGLPLAVCLFEAASAVGTVGLTLGITAGLHIFSQIILVILMFLGRVGGLTLIYAVLSNKGTINAKYPLDHITVG